MEQVYEVLDAKSPCTVIPTAHPFAWSAFCLEFEEAARYGQADDWWVKPPPYEWDAKYDAVPGVTLRDQLRIAQASDRFVTVVDELSIVTATLDRVMRT